MTRLLYGFLVRSNNSWFQQLVSSDFSSHLGKFLLYYYYFIQQRTKLVTTFCWILAQLRVICASRGSYFGFCFIGSSSHEAKSLLFSLSQQAHKLLRRCSPAVQRAHFPGPVPASQPDWQHCQRHPGQLREPESGRRRQREQTCKIFGLKKYTTRRASRIHGIILG